MDTIMLPADKSGHAIGAVTVTALIEIGCGVPHQKTFLRVRCPRLDQRQETMGNHSILKCLKVHGARCTHLSSCMPYRDPARRAAWMREYRKRKRVGRTGAPLSLSSPPSVVRVPEPSHVSRPTIHS